MDPTTAAMIGIGLYALSEIIGLSKYRANSVIQVVLEVLMRIFPRKIK